MSVDRVATREYNGNWASGGLPGQQDRSGMAFQAAPIHVGQPPFQPQQGPFFMPKPSSRKRTLAFERLESKHVPAALLVALAPLDDDSHQRLEPILHASADSSARAPQTVPADPDRQSGHWQFVHSVGALLEFVDQHTNSAASEPELCAAPTWDQCRAADEMLQLRDEALRTIVMTENLDMQDLPRR